MRYSRRLTGESETSGRHAGDFTRRGSPSGGGQLIRAWRMLPFVRYAAGRGTVGRRTYRVTVRGRLTSGFAAEFDGMTAETRNGETTLVGELADQAQLHGLLARIRDLGLDLVRLEAEEPAT
jgi:hypothetical protein